MPVVEARTTPAVGRAEMKTKARVSKLKAFLTLLGALPIAWVIAYISNPSGVPNSARASSATIFAVAVGGVIYVANGYLYWKRSRRSRTENSGLPSGEGPGSQE